jgi:hypothetical protein
MLNNSGIHGEIDMTSPGTGTIHGETVCLLVDGNDAVVGFDITSGFWAGYTLYFRYVDGGEGSNADPDYMYNAFFLGESDDCETFCQECADWGWAGTLEAETGNIQVNDGN